MATDKSTKKTAESATKSTAIDLKPRDVELLSNMVRCMKQKPDVSSPVASTHCGGELIRK